MQGEVVRALQAASQDAPTLLIDTLLSGDGYQLVHHVLSQQEAAARQRADGLAELLRLLVAAATPVEPPAPPPPPPAPGPAIVPAPYPRATIGGV